VKLHVWLAVRGFPAASFAPVVTVAVYVVEWRRGDPGVKVAVLDPRETEPGTGVVPRVRWKVEAVSVATSMASLNVAVMAALVATPAAPSTGLVAATVGGVVSAGVSPPPPPQPAARRDANSAPRTA
jgi:hypothetical protein